MPEWKPVKDIPELMESFNESLSQQAVPPPLPPTDSEGLTAKPPPLPGDSGAAESTPAGLSALEEQTYRLVLWLYRPWGGKDPWVRSYVKKNPKRGVVAAAATLLAGMLIAWLGITSILTPVEDKDAMGIQQQSGVDPRTQGDTGIFPPQQGVPPNWQENYRNWQQNQRANQAIMDDVYKYQRKSFDKQLDSYGNATYDWKQKDD